MGDESVSSNLICAGCGGSIGIYEPHVILGADGHQRVTVYATELELGPQPGERYHRQCAPLDPAGADA
jgi:hypothetical protein